jgi:Amt family ammonium transporter
MVIKKTIGFRVDAEAEVGGIDEAEHAESGYDFSSLGGRVGAGLAQSSLGGLNRTPTGPTATKERADR